MNGHGCLLTVIFYPSFFKTLQSCPRLSSPRDGTFDMNESSLLKIGNSYRAIAVTFNCRTHRITPFVKHHKCLFKPPSLFSYFYISHIFCQFAFNWGSSFPTTLITEVSHTFQSAFEHICFFLRIFKTFSLIGNLRQKSLFLPCSFVACKGMGSCSYYQ